VVRCPICLQSVLLSLLWLSVRLFLVLFLLKKRPPPFSLLNQFIFSHDFSSRVWGLEPFQRGSGLTHPLLPYGLIPRPCMNYAMVFTAAPCLGVTPWINDNICDDANNNEACQWDGGDCCGSNVDGDYCTECQCLDPNYQEP
jgi:hypothetical protein